MRQLWGKAGEECTWNLMNALEEQQRSHSQALMFAWKTSEISPPSLLGSCLSTWTWFLKIYCQIFLQDLKRKFFSTLQSDLFPTWHKVKNELSTTSLLLISCKWDNTSRYEIITQIYPNSPFFFSSSVPFSRNTQHHPWLLSWHLQQV